MDNIKVAVETVMKEKLEEEVVVIYNSLFNKTTKITLEAQGTDRSFEDRDVHFRLEDDNGEHVYTDWLRAEKAIELGQALIRQGNLAFKENMLNHQLFRMKEALRAFIAEGRVSKVILTVRDSTPINYGGGNRNYLVKPEWNEGMEPEFRENFCFEEVIYFSPFPEEYEEELKQFGEVVEFVGYDREAEVRKFEEAVMKGDF